jgi:ATP-binding cassette subfamily B protein
MTSLDIFTCGWPLERLGEAMTALGALSGITTPTSEPPPAPTMWPGPAAGPRAFGRWIEATAEWLGMEAESASIPYSALSRRLPECAPAIVRIPSPGPPRVLAILGGSRRRLSLLTPALETRRVGCREAAAFLREDREAGIGTDTDAVLEDAGLSPGRRARVRAALLDERLRLEDFEGVWLLRPEPSSSFARQVARAGLWRRLAALAGAHTAEYVCWILAWWLVGLGAMQGRLDRGWLLAWALLLVTIVPLRVGATWLQGTIAIAGGAILKQRLLLGALRMEPDAIGQEGAGHLLARVMESEAVESLALSGGFLALVSVIELLLAAAILAAGAGGPLEVALLVGWTALILWIGGGYLARNRVWAQLRLRLTHDLVEGMIGHRTRVAQQNPERWHDGEDDDLERYTEISRSMDRRAIWLAALGARGWLLLAVAALAPSFLNGSATPARLAVAIGGALLGYRALRRLSAGIWHLAEAWVAWQQVAPLFRAGARRDPPGAPELVIQSGRDNAEIPVLQAHDLTFRYPARPDPVLDGVSLRIAHGDRIWLDGASGAGKSTLASLLVGLRAPESGLLLAGGLDRRTLGAEGWRRRVASAPQFHENHVITGTFGFNLLMSRPDWPPSQEDVDMLGPLCRELGLDDLLARMPSGLMQMVGETGWQLSHGERSRLFLARALLQDASLVVLDESFAALDPDNLRRCLECARRRAPSLLVIGHR